MPVAVLCVMLAASLFLVPALLLFLTVKLYHTHQPPRVTNFGGDGGAGTGGKQGKKESKALCYVEISGVPTTESELSRFSFVEVFSFAIENVQPSRLWYRFLPFATTLAVVSVTIGYAPVFLRVFIGGTLAALDLSVLGLARPLRGDRAKVYARIVKVALMLAYLTTMGVLERYPQVQEVSEFQSNDGLRAALVDNGTVAFYFLLAIFFLCLAWLVLPFRKPANRALLRNYVSSTGCLCSGRRDGERNLSDRRSSSLETRLSSTPKTIAVRPKASPRSVAPLSSRDIELEEFEAA